MESKPIKSKKTQSKRRFPVRSNKSRTRQCILLVVIATVLIAGAQFFLKKGADLTTGSVLSYVNLWIITGLVVYGLATILFVISLKNGDLSTLYPILGLNYIWVSLIAYFVFKEALTSLNMLGIASIVIGVVILGRSENG
ncbi:MAG: hypothetical protein ACP5N3_03385 [Candidatus Nanoarchaeia archaeon]